MAPFRRHQWPRHRPFQSYFVLQPNQSPGCPRPQSLNIPDANKPLWPPIAHGLISVINGLMLLSLVLPFLSLLFLPHLPSLSPSSLSICLSVTAFLFFRFPLIYLISFSSPPPLPLFSPYIFTFPLSPLYSLISCLSHCFLSLLVFSPSSLFFLSVLLLCLSPTLPFHHPFLLSLFFLYFFNTSPSSFTYHLPSFLFSFLPSLPLFFHLFSFSFFSSSIPPPSFFSPFPPLLLSLSLLPPFIPIPPFSYLLSLPFLPLSHPFLPSFSPFPPSFFLAFSPSSSLI